MKLIQAIASALEARENCKLQIARQLTQTADARTADGFASALDWQVKHEERLRTLERALPRGSGLDNGTRICVAESGSDRIVLSTSFHHMNENGVYDGWTDHKVIVAPTFDDFKIRVTGRNTNGIKEYIADVFRNALQEESTL